MRGRRRRKNQKGVTLFEVMIGLALFAVIIVPVSRSFLTAMKVNQHSRETMIATDVAQSIMEGISGKSYFQMCTSLGKVGGGFDFSSPDARRNSGRYALSSINDSYYNCGNRTGTCGMISGFSAEVTHPITNTGIAGYTTTSSSGIFHRLDQVLVKPATDDLIGRAAAEPYTNIWKPSNNDADNVISEDKRLYYGQSAEKYVGGPLDGLPMVSYMLYSRVEKENQFFDVTVTFVPHAQNVRVAHPGTDKDTYFTYEVTVSVYPYEYDPKTSTFINRFDADGYIEGSPAAIMVSGMQSYRYEDETH